MDVGTVLVSLVGAAGSVAVAALKFNHSMRSAKNDVGTADAKSTQALQISRELRAAVQRMETGLAVSLERRIEDSLRQARADLEEYKERFESEVSRRSLGETTQTQLSIHNAYKRIEALEQWIQHCKAEGDKVRSETKDALLRIDRVDDRLQELREEQQRVLGKLEGSGTLDLVPRSSALPRRRI
jgi:hypothetical protein